MPQIKDPSPIGMPQATPLPMPYIPFTPLDTRQISQGIQSMIQVNQFDRNFDMQKQQMQNTEDRTDAEIYLKNRDFFKDSFNQLDINLPGQAGDDWSALLESNGVTIDDLAPYLSSIEGSNYIMGKLQNFAQTPEASKLMMTKLRSDKLMTAVGTDLNNYLPEQQEALLKQSSDWMSTGVWDPDFVMPNPGYLAIDNQQKRELTAVQIDKGRTDTLKNLQDMEATDEKIDMDYVREYGALGPVVQQYNEELDGLDMYMSSSENASVRVEIAKILAGSGVAAGDATAMAHNNTAYALQDLGNPKVTDKRRQQTLGSALNYLKEIQMPNGVMASGADFIADEHESGIRYHSGSFDAERGVWTIMADMYTTNEKLAKEYSGSSKPTPIDGKRANDHIEFGPKNFVNSEDEKVYIIRGVKISYPPYVDPSKPFDASTDGIERAIAPYRARRTAYEYMNTQFGNEKQGEYSLPIVDETGLTNQLIINKYGEDRYMISDDNGDTGSKIYTQSEYVSKFLIPLIESQGGVPKDHIRVSKPKEVITEGPEYDPIRRRGTVESDPTASFEWAEGDEDVRLESLKYDPINFKDESASPSEAKLREMQSSHPVLQSAFQDIANEYPGIVVTEVGRGPGSSLYKEGTDHAYGKLRAFDVRSKVGIGVDFKEFLFDPSGGITDAGELYLRNRGVGALLEFEGLPNEHIHIYKLSD